MAATVAGVLLAGTHAARPAASAVSAGTLYSCSDHSLVYQSDASSWSTWANLAGTGSMATDALWDAKGDLAGGTGANTAVKLVVGTNGQVLTADSGETTGMKWATPSGAAFSGCLAYSNALQLVGSSLTAAALNAEEYDTSTYHDNSTNNSRLTVPTTGYYHVTGRAFSGSAGWIYLRINGSTLIRGTQIRIGASNTSNSTSATVALTAADYVEFILYNDGSANYGSTTDVEKMTSLDIALLGS